MEKGQWVVSKLPDVVLFVALLAEASLGLDYSMLAAVEGVALASAVQPVVDSLATVPS
jgi:hypothetical protein